MCIFFLNKHQEELNAVMDIKVDKDLVVNKNENTFLHDQKINRRIPIISQWDLR